MCRRRFPLAPAPVLQQRNRGQSTRWVMPMDAAHAERQLPGQSPGTGLGTINLQLLSILQVGRRFINLSASSAVVNRAARSPRPQRRQGRPDALRRPMGRRLVVSKQPMDIDQILADLDKHASEFNFPVLDNAYVEFAAARLSAFRGTQDWLVCFEVLGFSTREVAFVDDLYAYGSCIPKGGFCGEQVRLSSAEKQPLFDEETNECIADWSHWSIQVNG